MILPFHLDDDLDQGRPIRGQIAELCGECIKAQLIRTQGVCVDIAAPERGHYPVEIIPQRVATADQAHFLFMEVGIVECDVIFHNAYKRVRPAMGDSGKAGFNRAAMAASSEA